MFFFMTDQHRVDTLPCYGNEVVQTPWLDSLAAQGTVFDRFYTPTAICTPARASLLTGEAPFRHQLLANYERNVGYKEDSSSIIERSAGICASAATTSASPGSGMSG